MRLRIVILSKLYSESINRETVPCIKSPYGKGGGPLFNPFSSIHIFIILYYVKKKMQQMLKYQERGVFVQAHLSPTSANGAMAQDPHFMFCTGSKKLRDNPFHVYYCECAFIFSCVILCIPSCISYLLLYITLWCDLREKIATS